MTPLESALLEVMEPLANLDELSWQDARTFQLAGELLSTWRGDPKPTPQEALAARERAGITQKQLSRLAHVSPMTVRRWEHGTYRENGEDHKLATPHWLMWFYKLRRKS